MSENPIKDATDLVTPKADTRAGFIALALEKNYLAVPYIEEAKALKVFAQQARMPAQLLETPEIRAGLVAASCLSDKSQNHLTEEDKTLAVKGLIEKFLEPAGANFADELVYRYLLTKGDALGGQARNLAGTLGERKFLRTLLSVLNLAGKDYFWKDANTRKWMPKPSNDADLEKQVRGLQWTNDAHERLLLLNLTVPAVAKNVDIALLNGNFDQLKREKDSLIYQHGKYIALGELKGGIDPAGADEHWKTANSALRRIRDGFERERLRPHTFFIGAAIENSMAEEIFGQLKSGSLGRAANLTNHAQLTDVCDWLLHL